MRTASFPRDQPRSTFPHLKCQLHLFLAFHLFPTSNQLLASSPASCRNAFLSLFFFSWELWILIPLKGFYEDISFFFLEEVVQSVQKIEIELFRIIAFWIWILWIDWIYHLKEWIRHMIRNEEYLDSKSLSKCYMIIGLIGM